jgi:hypothetical protein
MHKIKYWKVYCFILAIIGLSLIAAEGQTVTITNIINITNFVNSVATNPVQQTSLDRGFNALFGGGITNFSVDAYGTWAPKAPKGTQKIGGGVLALYDFNQNASAGIGLDYLGSLSLVSGNFEGKLPVHISTLLPFLEDATTPQWLKTIGNQVMIPFGLVGIGTAYTGNGHFNGAPMAITDIGDAVTFGHVLGGEFNGGVAWGKWIGAGPYGDITRYHLFFGYDHGITVPTISTTAMIENGKDRFADSVNSIRDGLGYLFAKRGN